MNDEFSRSTTTVCPLCAVGCSLERSTDCSRATGRTGPANPNGRLCSRGVNAFERVPEDRLSRPRIRQDDEVTSVSWENAYEHIVEQFEAVLQEHGPDAIAFLGAPHCTNEENYLLQKLARMLGTNNVDNRARLCHVSTTRTLSDRVGWPATTNGLDDLGEADVILVAGANPAERQPVAFNSFVRPAVNNGTTLIHIDPVANQTTRLADIHLTPHPDMDALVFDLLCKHVFEVDGTNTEFVAQRTRGYDEFVDSLAEIDQEETLKRAGVDAKLLSRVGDTIAEADRVGAMVGTGIETAVAETNVPGSILNLLLLTGGIGRRGTGMYVLRGLVNEQGATDAGCVPDRLPGHKPVSDPAARDRIAEEWGIRLPIEPGKPADKLLESFGDEIRAALVVGENPAVSKQSHDWIRDKLDSLDCLVVVDIQTGETTRHADVVLPAAASFEKSGTVTNLDRRIQRLRPVSTSPDGARSDFTILRDIGYKILDRKKQFAYTNPSEVFDEWTKIASTHSGMSDTELTDSGCRWPFERGGVLYRDEFGTPDGLAAFENPQLPTSYEATSGLRLVTGGRKTTTDSAVTKESFRIHPTDAAENGIKPGGEALISNGEVNIVASITFDDNVRRGTVYAHATIADPFLRSGTQTVTIAPHRIDKRKCEVWSR